MNLGKAIREARLEAGYTQEGLAKRVNVSRSLIAKYEVGLAKPDPEMMRALETTLGLKEGSLSRNKFSSLYYLLFVFLCYVLAIGLFVMAALYFVDLYPQLSVGSVCPEEGVCFPTCSTYFTSVWYQHLHSLVYVSLPLNTLVGIGLAIVPFFPKAPRWLRILMLALGVGAVVFGIFVFCFDAVSDPNAFNAC